MTAQAPERLVHRGRTLDLCAQPLEPLLRRRPKARRPDFVWTDTTCLRGYEGTWEIIDGRLHLVALVGTVADGDGFREIGLDAVFPMRRPPIPATWVTDRLRCPEGRLRVYTHMGFASLYERDRFFDVWKGQVQAEWLVYNPPPPLAYRIEPDGRRVFCTEGPFGEAEPRSDPFPDGAPVEPWRLWGRRDWGFALDREDPDDGVVLMASTVLGAPSGAPRSP